jgi:hypothetical protein
LIDPLAPGAESVQTWGKINYCLAADRSLFAETKKGTRGSFVRLFVFAAAPKFPVCAQGERDEKGVDEGVIV